jgi:hypothetical protein
MGLYPLAMGLRDNISLDKENTSQEGMHELADFHTKIIKFNSCSHETQSLTVLIFVSEIEMSGN